MIKVVKNEKDYGILKLNINEAIKFHLSNNGKCICKECRKVIDTDINFIVEENDTFCNKCLNEFLIRENKSNRKKLIENFINLYKRKHEYL